jgi:hypothetical protein
LADAKQIVEADAKKRADAAAKLIAPITETTSRWEKNPEWRTMR